MMYDRFFESFSIEPGTPDPSLMDRLSPLQKSIGGFYELFSVAEGINFGNGLYRLHRLEDIPKWNEMIEQGFSSFVGIAECFGSDWLGRQFAVDTRTSPVTKILMFEPGTGYAFEIPCNFVNFHNKEMIEDGDSCLEASNFTKWLKDNPSGLKGNQCAGYIIPLILSGNDEFDNMKVSDLDVYWSICSQILSQTRDLPDGTVISKFFFVE